MSRHPGLHWSNFWPVRLAWVFLVYLKTKLVCLRIQPISIHTKPQIFWPFLKRSQSISLALNFLGAWPAQICILTAKLTLCSSENHHTILHASKQDQGQGSRSCPLLLLPDYKTSIMSSTQWVSRLPPCPGHSRYQGTIVSNMQSVLSKYVTAVVGLNYPGKVAEQVVRWQEEKNLV